MVLLFGTVYAGKFEFRPCIPRLINNFVGGKVLNYRANKSTTFTWLYVLKLLDRPQLAVYNNNRTDLHLITGDHNHKAYSRFKILKYVILGRCQSCPQCGLNLA